ncbi:hypothetical protein [Erythrobacter rubeus]|uniref:Uncharacterized protein n=1 Tax=Erythrobacter rubeus TaxID=2760803 RepID=A0ABR8KVE1_9SPHN|nr:hypothetical protein [Erythrobacter rubeus]MBD2842374.1 hypothetical protein [Erythrobacter rubeus]
MRNIVILLVVFLIGIGAWFLLRDGGLIEQVTETRVEEALLANQVPAPMAACMAPRLVDRLSIDQLRKLERAAPQDGENTIPLSTGEAMARLRRVDDREALEAVVTVAGGCGFELLLQGR